MLNLRRIPVVILPAAIALGLVMAPPVAGHGNAVAGAKFCNASTGQCGAAFRAPLPRCGMKAATARRQSVPAKELSMFGSTSIGEAAGTVASVPALFVEVLRVAARAVISD